VNEGFDTLNRKWPIYIQDRDGRTVYITRERWDHALDHPGMSDDLLDSVLETLRTARRKQDSFDPTKYKYTKDFIDLPFDYTHVVVVVKFSVSRIEPRRENNFVLTAYLVEKRSR